MPTLRLVADINPGSDGSQPSMFTAVGNTLFFTANDGSSGNELWKSDGTAAGTVRIAEINNGFWLWDINHLTVVGNTLFFAAENFYRPTGIELWKSDGTAEGTVQVTDINPGYANSNPSELTAVGNILFFLADDGSRGSELWKSDGSAAGTARVADIRPGYSSSSPSNLIAVGNTLFFTANDGSSGNELWKSDGTVAGTVRVADINPGGKGSYPSNLTTAGNTLFFSANDGFSGYELWKSDGTAAGTVRVANISEEFRPGIISSSSPSNFTAVGNTLFFTANDGSNGSELWKSDGTAAGTVRVADINKGDIFRGSYPRNLTAVANTLFFTAGNGSSGRELWKSDGTDAGTVLVADIIPGSGYSVLNHLTAFGNTLFFTADDGSSGNELWKSDGTAEGTVPVADITLDNVSSYPNHLTAVGDILFLSADHGRRGRELWGLDFATELNQLSFTVTNTPIPAASPGRTVGEFRNHYAFAALKANGSVITWGSSRYGGDSSGVAEQLSSGVTQIFSSSGAFAALKSDGSVVTWGSFLFGGDRSGLTAGQTSTSAHSDVPPQVAVNVVQAGSEDGGTQASVFRIERRGPSTTALTIPYRIFGTATPNIDYALPQGSSIENGSVQGFVVLQPGETAITLTLPTLVDSVVDAGESLQIWLQPPTDGSYSIAPGGQSAGLIIGAESMAALDAMPKQPTLRAGASSYHNSDALALLRDDGSIAVWGDPAKGGALGDIDLDGPNNDLTIQQMVSSMAAMAALRSDGSVISWGDSFYGGNSSALNFRGADKQQKVLELVADRTRIYALLSDGTALMWGSGGKADGAYAASVAQIIPTDSSFDGALVIHKDGSLSIPAASSSSSKPPSLLTESSHPDFAPVVDVRHSNGNYLALRGDGSAVTWGPRASAVIQSLGDSNNDGIADPLQKGVVAIADGDVGGSGFSAILQDGSIISWGAPGSDAEVPSYVINDTYKSIYGSEVRFTSLAGGFGGITEAGELIQWTPHTTAANIFLAPKTSYEVNGRATSADRSSYVRLASDSKFHPVVDLIANRVALRADGSVIAWGNSTNGGYNENEKAKHDLLALGQLNGLSSQDDRQQIVKVVQSSYQATGGNANEIAFAALRADGSVITWGASGYGGNAETVLGDANNNLIADSLESGVVGLYGFWDGFIALKNDGSVVRWSKTSGSRGVFSGYFGVDFDGDGLVSDKDPAPFEGPLAAVAMVHPAFPMRVVAEPTWLAQLSSGVTEIFSTNNAFAALKDDGSVVTWGDSSSGGLIRGVAGLISSDVTKIFSTLYAFAALKADGSIVTWGDSSYGGNSSGVANQISSGVTQIFSTHAAFAALKVDGSVVTWGDTSRGGNSSGVAAQVTSGVIQIFSTEGAFAALKADGSVITWGDSASGGDSSDVADRVSSDVTEIFSTGRAFAALKADGSVVTWGDPLFGGSSSEVAGQLGSGVVEIFSTGRAFAALKADGSVVTWGDPLFGGSSSEVVGQLSSGVVWIFSTDKALAALKADGSVVTWGDSSYGGNSSGVANQISSGVTHIFSTGSAFAALKADGSVVSWGDSNSGGNSSGVDTQLTDIASLANPFMVYNLGQSTFSITGTQAVGQILSAAIALPDPDGDGDGAINYTWQATADGSSWTDIGTGPNLIITEVLEGQQLRLFSSYTDAKGFTEVVITFADLVPLINKPPTYITLRPGYSEQTLDFYENNITGSYIAKLHTFDPDFGDNFAYDFAAGDGDTDNMTFSIIDGDQLVINSSADYEIQNIYKIRVRSTDQGGLFVEEALTFNVLDANEPPTALELITKISSLPENFSTVYRIKLADCVIRDDAPGSIHYSLSGADSEYFELNWGSLYLKAGTVLDFETKASFAVTVSARDLSLPDSNPVTSDFYLEISDVNEVSEAPMGSPIRLTTNSYNRVVISGEAGGALFYNLQDDLGIYEPWKADGIATFYADTPITKTRVNNSNDPYILDGPVGLGDMHLLYGFSGLWGSSLWKLHSTATEAEFIAKTKPNVSDLTVVDNTLFFTQHERTSEKELWKSDGTAEGTERVANIPPGSYSSANLTAIRNTLFFTADDGSSGRGLWKSDGTADGTVRLADISLGSRISSDTITAVGNTLFFTADDGSSGRELWKSDGTADGTVRVADIRPGNYGSSPNYLTAVGNTLFFTADDGSSGRELWKSDGTADGTVLVADIHWGYSSSFPTNLTAAGNTLFFTADDGRSGRELWKADGTSTGTVLAADINPGAESSNPIDLTFVGDFLFFLASDGIITHPHYTNALWALEVDPVLSSRFLISKSSFDENIDAGSTVASLDTKYGEPSDATVYDFTAGEGDTDNNLFLIIGNQVAINSSPDYETKNIYNIRIRGTDQDGFSLERAFTLSVNNINDYPALNLLNAVSSIYEGRVDFDIKLADIVIIDDALGTNIITLSGEDAASFGVQGTELFLKAGSRLDFETKAAYAITVSVSDPALPGSTPFTAAFSLAIRDRNEPPTALSLSNTVRSLAEDTSTTSRIKVADIVITDDALGNNLINLAGADADSFEVIGTELFLKAGTALDFETKSSYAITVSAWDSSFTALSLSEAFSLAVSDLNEPPIAETVDILSTPTGSRLTVDTTDAAEVIANLRGSPDLIEIHATVSATLNAISTETWSSRYVAVNFGSTTKAGTGERIPLAGIGKYSFVATATPDAITEIVLEQDKNTAFFLHDAYSAFFSGLQADLVPDSTGRLSTQRVLNIDTIRMGSAGGTSIVDLTSKDYITGAVTVHGADKGRSVFWGTDADDTFISGGGGSVIYGGAGANSLTLGAGIDTLQYRTGVGAQDLIIGFDPVNDKLQLWLGSDQVSSEPTFTSTNTDTTVSWADNTLTFLNLPNLSLANLQITQHTALI